MDGRVCIAIDLKSFYASVECVDRGLDPLTTNLVVADETRTDKTICLAVTPALKAHGLPGRARLFEVRQKAREKGLEFLIAPPRMARYMEVSNRIYSIYLNYISTEDIHVYSIDEVFIEATAYMKTYGCSAHDLAMRMVKDVLSQTGITATAGIGSNLYLAKIAMDIEAKHSAPDKDGVRIAELDEMSYRQNYWDHRPLTDFWRIGHGLAAKLEANYMYTMGDIALCSINCEERLYKLFGVNAELLIDHAWGWEPCTIKQIKEYRPSSNSLSCGQVLSHPYPFEKARLVVKEMTDGLSFDLVEKGLVTDQIILSVGYDGGILNQDGGDGRRDDSGNGRRDDSGNAKGQSRQARYSGPVVSDWYGRDVPKPAHGSINLSGSTSSSQMMTDAAMALFDRIVDRNIPVRRMYVVANHTVREESSAGVQLDLFETGYDTEKERKRQEAILAIRKKYGKNAILKGMNFEEGATAIERNGQIGGHRA